MMNHRKPLNATQFRLMRTPRCHFSQVLDSIMPFVVTDNCIRCKFTDCVDVCPVDCFHEGPNFLVINPDECIDCTLCEPECPAQAIYSDGDLPPEHVHFIELNAELCKIWPVITERKPALPDAEQWKGIQNKISHLER